MNGFSFPRARFLFVLLACLLGVAAGPVAAKPAKAKILDLTDTVLANRIMTKFALVLRASELTSLTSSRGPFTLFAPTDSAFSKLPPGVFEALLRPENQAVCQQVLLFHVVNGNRFSAKDLLAQKSLVSCEGHPLAVHTSKSGAQFVQKARILHADMRCANGVIHEIDTVLVPPGVVLPTPLSPEAAAAAAAAPPSTNNDEAPATNAPAAVTDTNAAPADTNAPPAETNAAAADTNAPAMETNAASTNEETNPAPTHSSTNTPATSTP